MENDMNTIKEAAVNTTAAEQAIASVLGSVQAGQGHAQEQQDDQLAIQPITVTATAAIVIDEAKKQELELKFRETINNPRFWAKEARFDTLMDNLEVPMFDDRSLQQFYIHATDDLYADAARLSQRTKVPAELPTEVECKTEAWKRYIAKQTDIATKAFKKNKVKATDDMIQAVVQAELDKLTDRQEI